MATFEIHQDANVNKENPMLGTVPVHKEKTMTLGLNAKQPLAVIGGAGLVVGAGGGGGLKEKTLAPRGNFAVLNQNNTNVQQQRNGIAASKVAFRDVGNLKAKDDNIVATKKTNAAVPVEQFKQFSVYEDNYELYQQHVAKSLSTAAAVTGKVATDKENLYDRYDAPYDSMHKNYLQHSFDGTPMSVTDVLSPMSVDNSHLSVSMSKLTDDSKDEIAETSELLAEQNKELPPRNDRQRFFEVVEYQRDILEYFRESEIKHRPNPKYMRRQSDINHSMRTILVDWLVEVSEEYKLDTETLYLAVSYIDRFLSQMSVVRSKLQLVGTAAMYIASKYEEIYPPDVGEFVFITDDTYTKAQVLRMEQIILKILAFDLCTPTTYVFINTYAVLLDMPDKLKNLTLYISELALLDADPYLYFLPSQISAASLALARYLLGEQIWTPELAEITTYSLSDLRELVMHLHKTHASATTLAQQAIKEKYSREKFKQVSEIDTLALSVEHFDELLQTYNETLAAEKNKEQKLLNAANNITKYF